MTYGYRCPQCGKDYDIAIQLSEYDKMKGTVVCPDCNCLVKRTYSVGITRPSADGRGFYGKKG